MLYFVRPFGGLEWTANVGQNVIDMARENGKDLGALTDWWQRAERASDELDVRIALRYGLAATGGIAVAATHIVVVRRPNELRTLAAASAARMTEYRESAAVKVVDRIMERDATGWTEYGRQLDADVAKSMIGSIEEAKADASEELAQPIQPELVKHWQSLGGWLPDPV